MKNLLIILICTMILACSEADQGPERKWATPAELKIPESVKYDPAREVLYVSNINGRSGSRDGNGFITRLSLNGEVTDLKWVEGLSAPKGMAIHEDRLYVSDIDMLVEIDIEKSEIISSYEADGAGFLNDVAVDSTGLVYVSDSSGNVIYRLRNGKMEVWFSDENLKRPNGLHIKGGRLYVGDAGSIKIIDTGTGKMKILAKTGFGVDGLVSDGMGGFIVSDWSGKTSRLDKRGKLSVILDTSGGGINSADIEYIVDKKLLIIPTFRDNRAMAYYLGGMF